MIWFWWWLLFVVLLLVIPLSYGWGYRGWGAPYPSYYQRRRTPTGARAVDPDTVVVEDPDAEEAAAWGVLADILWVLAIVALVWLVLGLLL